MVDLAKGHLAALKRLSRPGFESYNLGTGTPTTVLQLVEAFKNTSGVDVPYGEFNLTRIYKIYTTLYDK